MRRVAKATGVSMETVCAGFGSKGDLLVAVMDVAVVGLPPAPKLPRSRLNLAWANDQRTIPDGQPRSHRDAPDPALRALTQA